MTSSNECGIKSFYNRTNMPTSQGFRLHLCPVEVSAISPVRTGNDDLPPQAPSHRSECHISFVHTLAERPATSKQSGKKAPFPRMFEPGFNTEVFHFDVDLHRRDPHLRTAVENAVRYAIHHCKFEILQQAKTINHQLRCGMFSIDAMRERAVGAFKRKTDEDEADQQEWIELQDLAK